MRIKTGILVLVLNLAYGGRLIAENSHWTFESTMYGLAAGMSGTVGVGPVNANLDVGFDDILDNLEFGFMGKVRVGYDQWALTTDVVYMGLGVSKDQVSADMDQWLVEPTLSYRFCENFEALVGVRYNSLSGELRGPGVLPTPVIVTGTQDWWDPIIGANISVPWREKFSFNLRADIGGFGVGSDLTWQAFPFVSWRVSQSSTLHVGYRFLDVDYETGSGADQFRYDVLTQGPQFGFTYRF